MANSFIPPQEVGFIGLGNMGAPMAHRLHDAGYRLTVADASAAAVDRFRAQHEGIGSGAVHEMAGRCPVVITMLPDGKVVREVLLGAAGLVHDAGEGLTVIDMSSSSAVGTRALAAELERHECVLIDAPVSGGVKKAVDGSLAIMAGGEKTAIEYFRPLLEVMGKVFPTGATGSGHAMKALNNYLSAASLATAAEAIMAGEQFGLDPATMVDILNVSSGRSNSTQTKYPDYILNRTFNSGFGIGLLAKDLGLAREVAGAAGTPAILMQACTEIWQAAAAGLGAEADHTEIVKYLETMAQGQPHD